MSTGNSYHSFTAADIERYYKGQMSAAERHALEKAALDDPFLADALEGYQYSGNAGAELTDLHSRLSQRVDEAPVVPMQRSRGSYGWLRAVAMLVILVGAAVLAIQFLSDKKKDEIAVIDPKNADSVTANSPGNESAGPLVNDTAADADVTASPISSPVNSATGQSDTTQVSPAMGIADVNNPSVALAEEKSREQKTTEPGKTHPAEGAAANKEKKEDREDLAKRSVTKESDNVQATSAARAKKDNQAFYKDEMKNLNTFYGRVTDEQNRGLPFANVTNTRDNVGTYTDVAGNFVLTSPDSTLHVQVRSLGYDDNREQLRNNAGSNRIVMQPDNSISETIVSRSNSNAMRRNVENMKVEEPEPADGWANYDVYLSNNLNPPVDFKPKPSLSQVVELSFEVNKQGEPVNIRVERSLCSSCDREAIRLVQEGPRWKRSGKKRTRVTVNF